MRLLNIITLLLASILSLDTLAAYPFAGAGMPAVIQTKTVTANLASTSHTIPSNFIGISFNMESMVPVSGFATWLTDMKTNSSIISLIKLLGTNGHIRIGGNQQDASGSGPELTQTVANGIGSFMSSLGSGWSLYYGLDLTINNTATAVTHAGYILSAVTGNTVAFGIGNEPDDGCCGNMTTWTSNYNSYYSALTSAYPSVIIEGADVANGQVLSTVENYANATTPGPTGLAQVTGHSYFGDNPTQSQIQTLLNETAGFGWASFVSYASNFRIDESNLGSGQTNTGVVKTLATGAWFIAAANEAASSGVVGIDLNQGGSMNSAYPNSVGNDYNFATLDADYGFSPNPMFYYMYLFSKIVGQTIVSTSLSGTGTVSAISTAGAHGNANIMVVNYSTINPVKITPAQSNSWTSANVYKISAGSNAGCFDSSPNIGGATIGESGVWNGTMTPISISNGGSFALYPCEAALVQILP